MSDDTCGCLPAWPALEVRLTDDYRVPVEPAATPGPMAHLYYARCVGCSARYTGPFRVPPR